MTPLGMDGIAPDGTRILLCGLSYRQIVDVACERPMNQKEAAKRLGVNYAHFNAVVNRLGCQHWFVTNYHPPCRITPEDVIQVASEGYTQNDAAYLLGYTYTHFRTLVTQWKLRHLFPRNGAASWIGQRGYCQ